MNASERNMVESSLGRDILYAARYYVGGRRGLLLVGGAIVALGLASNWSWLVAAGLAPLLLAMLPCLAMCALGLCMNKMVGRSCSTEKGAAAEKASALPSAAADPNQLTLGLEIRGSVAEPAAVPVRPTAAD